MIVQKAASPFPHSFGGDPYLYGGALASLMTIGILALVTASWMVRDIWLDRREDYPTQLSFVFRAMIATIAAATFLRCLPEVVYLTIYGDPGISDAAIETVLNFKRIADVVALPAVVSWMAMLVLIYPFVIIALKTQDSRRVRMADAGGLWYRLARPFVILLCVALIASLMAFSKSHFRG